MDTKVERVQVFNSISLGYIITTTRAYKSHITSHLYLVYAVKCFNTSYDIDFFPDAQTQKQQSY